MIDTLMQLTHALDPLAHAVDAMEAAEKKLGSTLSASSSSSVVVAPFSSASLSPSATAASVLLALHPYALFFEFLSLLSFDHSTLLDFLLSNETQCLAYLTIILRRLSRAGPPRATSAAVTLLLQRLAAGIDTTEAAAGATSTATTLETKELGSPESWGASLPRPSH